jgi:ABC-type spermidine/putrescine transport system permease subunit II
MIPDLGILAISWIAGLALSWILAVLRSAILDIGLIVCTLLAYGFSVNLDRVRLAIVVTSLVVLATRARFEEADRAYGDDARSLGASEWRLAVRLLPLAWPRILMALAMTLLLSWVAA